MASDSTVPVTGCSCPDRRKLELPRNLRFPDQPRRNSPRKPGASRAPIPRSTTALLAVSSLAPRGAPSMPVPQPKSAGGAFAPQSTSCKLASAPFATPVPIRMYISDLAVAGEHKLHAAIIPKAVKKRKSNKALPQASSKNPGVKSKPRWVGPGRRASRTRLWHQNR